MTKVVEGITVKGEFKEDGVVINGKKVMEVKGEI